MAGTTVEIINLQVRTNAGSAASQVKSLSSALKSLRGVGRSVSGASRGLSGIGHAARDATKHTSKLFSSIKRIAMYRMLRTALKEIAKAFSDGLKNAYAFSKGIGGSLASALDTIATKSMTMKNQLGAAFGGLLEAIEPILLRIIELIKQAANAISMLFAAFSGGDYLVAKDVEQSWDKATGAAKKYKNTILGFDEINRLNDETGGGGGSSVDASNMFELGTIPESLQNFVDDVKSLIAHENWKSLGQFIATKINDTIKGIDFWSIAETIGQKINGAITAAFNFLKTLDIRGITSNLFAALSHAMNQIDFQNVGGILARRFTMIGDLLLGALQGIDWNGLGKALGDTFRGIFNHLGEWFETVDWKQTGTDLFNAVKNFLTGIDFESLAESFWEALKGAIRAAGGLLSGVLEGAVEWMNETDWYAVGDKFYQKLKITLEGIDFANIATSVFTFLGTALASGIQAIASFIWDVVSDISDYFKQYIEDMKDKYGDNGWAILYGILDGIWEAMKDIGKWIFDNILKPFVDAFEKVFGISSPAKEMEKPGEYVGLGILEGVLKPFKDIYEWIKTNIFDPFVNGFKSAFGMGEDGESVTFRNLGEKIVEGLQSGFKSMWDTFFENVKTWWQGLSDWWNGLSLKTITGNVSASANYDNLYTPKFHAEGGTFRNDGTLFVAGEAGAEVVANLGNKTGVMNVNQMEAAVANGNIGVINAIYGMANMVVKAVESIDTDVVLDGETLADKMYRYNQNAANRYGTPMVT